MMGSMAIKDDGKPKPTILVVSHERSGTHYLINSIAKNLGYSNQEESLLGTKDTIFRRIFDRKDDGVIFKSHHQYEYLCPVIEKISKAVKVIYILRDGRDVLASFFHYVNIKGNSGVVPGCFPSNITFSEMLRSDPRNYTFDSVYSLIRSTNMAERWARHIKGWTNRVYSVRFEGMKKEFPRVMSGIAQYVGVDHDGPWTEPTLLDRGMGNRKGIVGDYIGVFSEEDCSFFDSETKKVIGVG